MILVLGGTTEGRELAQLLYTDGHKSLLSTATQLGTRLVSAPLEKRWGALDKTGLARLIAERGIRLVVDATHPFAATASRNAMAACQKLGIGYLRLERPSTPLSSSNLVHLVDGFDVAVELAFELGQRVLLTIGSHNLTPFLEEARRCGVTLLVRILPQAVADCLSLGIPQEHIIVFQGVDSVEGNRAQFKRYRTQVVVCKDSGPQGGTPQKVAAAVELGLPVVVIRRPRISYPRQVSSVKQVLEIINQGGLCQLTPE